MNGAFVVEEKNKLKLFVYFIFPTSFQHTKPTNDFSTANHKKPNERTSKQASERATNTFERELHTQNFRCSIDLFIFSLLSSFHLTCYFVLSAGFAMNGMEQKREIRKKGGLKLK